MRSTIKQAADYYGVNEKTVKRILTKNKAEFAEDGIQIVSSIDVRKLTVKDTDVPHKQESDCLLLKLQAEPFVKR